MPHLLVFPQTLFLLDLALDLVVFLLAKPIGEFAREPAPSEPLDVEGGLVAALLPHVGVEVEIGQEVLVSAAVQPQALLLHLRAHLPLDTGGFGDPLVSLRFASVAELVVGLLLVSLCEGVPVLDVGIDVAVASQEGLFLVDADDLDDLHPLVSDVALLVPLHHCRLDVVVVVDAVGQLGVGSQHHLSRFHHLLVTHRSYIYDYV